MTDGRAAVAQPSRWWRRWSGGQARRPSPPLSSPSPSSRRCCGCLAQLPQHGRTNPLATWAAGGGCEVVARLEVPPRQWLGRPEVGGGVAVARPDACGHPLPQRTCAAAWLTRQHDLASPPGRLCGCIVTAAASGRAAWTGKGALPPPWLSVPLVCRRVVVAGAAGVAVEGVHGGGHFAAGCLRAGSLETEGWWGTDQHLTHNATNQPPSALLPPSPSPPSLLIIKARQAVRTGR